MTLAYNQRNLQTLATDFCNLQSLLRLYIGFLNLLVKATTLELIIKRKGNFSVHFESKSLSSSVPKIWELVATSIREKKH